MIFDEDDVLSILVEFENDRMSPQESPENGRIVAHGLNFKIFVNSDLIFEIYDENYTIKKISCLSDHFKIFVTQPGRSLHIVNEFGSRRNDGRGCPSRKFQKLSRSFRAYLNYL